MVPMIFWSSSSDGSSGDEGACCRSDFTEGLRRTCRLLSVAFGLDR